MAQVHIGSVYSFWKELTEEEQQILWKFNQAEEKKKFFAKKFSRFASAGEVRLYDRMTGRLPSGLVKETIEELEKNGFKVSITNQTPKSLPERKSEFYEELDQGHQFEAVVAMSENSRGIIHAATNAGKTRIAQVWCCLHQAKTIYVVPSLELLHQTYTSFKANTNLKLGTISGQSGWNIGEDVTIALASTISHFANQKKFKELAKEFTAIILDECHHAASKTWKFILRSCVNAHHRFGMSGTPWTPGDRADELKVKQFLGPTIFKVTNAFLIEKNWSAKPEIKMIPINDRSTVTFDMDYQEIYECGIVNSVPRNSIVTKIAREFHNQERSCLIVLRRLDQVSFLSDLLSLQKIPHGILTGETEKTIRKELIQEFRSGKLFVMISNILGEGLDIPRLEGLIFAGGEKAHKSLLQRVGRGLRKKSKGPNTVEIYDFADYTHPLLANHTLQRLKTYEEEGFEISEIRIGF